MPPDGLRLMLPVALSKQSTCEVEDPEVLSAAAGWVMTALELVVHPLASVTVTVYDPAAIPEMFWVVEPWLQRNVYGVVPPEMFSVTEASDPELQETFCEALTDEERAATGCVTCWLCVVVHPFASVTVAV